MATVDVAIRAIFSGKSEFANAAEAIQTVISKLDELDSEAADTGGLDTLISRANVATAALKDPSLLNPSTITEQINAFEAMAMEMEELAVAATNLQQTTLGEDYLGDANQLRAKADTLRQIRGLLDNIGEAQQRFGKADIFEALRGAKGPEEIGARLIKLREEFKAITRAALESGDALKSAHANESLEQVDKFIRKFAKMADEVGLTIPALKEHEDQIKKVARAHRNTANTFGLMFSKINQIGFTFLITKNSIMQFVNGLKSLVRWGKEGAETLDLLNAFNSTMEMSGKSGQVFTQQLRAASGGLIKINTAQTATQRLMKAGIPQFDQVAIKLSVIAKNAARLSGEVGDADMIFDKLIRGVIKGSPRLIDETDIVLKLGNVYEDYAESVGKAANELSEQEKQLAVLQALEEEGKRINELSEALGELPSEKLARFTNHLEEVSTALKGVFGTFIADAVGNLFGISEAMDEMSPEEAIEKTRIWKESLREVEDIVIRINRGSLINDDDIRKLDHFRAQLDPIQAMVVDIRVFFSTIFDFFKPLALMLKASVEGMLIPIKLFGGLIDETLSIAFMKLEKFIAEAKLSFEELKNIGPLNMGDPEKIAALKAEVALLGEEIDKTTRAGSEELVKGLARDYGNMFSTWLDGMEAAKRAMPTTENNALRLAEAMGILGLESRAAGDNLQHLADGSQASTGFLEKQLEVLQMLIGREGKLLRDEAAVWEKHAEDIKKSQIKLREDLNKVREDYNKKREKIESDWAEEDADILDDLEKKKADIEDDAAKDRQKAIDKFNKDERRKETRHQEKLEKIRQRFDLARIKALIDRDARALFEAQLKRDQDLANEEKSHEQAKRERQEDHNDRLNQIEAEKLAEIAAAEAAAEEKRRKAKEDRDKELRDLKDWAKERRAELKAAAKKAQKLITDAANDRIEALRERYREEILMEQAAQLEKEINEKLSLARRADNYAEFNQTVATLSQQLAGFLQNYGGQLGGLDFSNIGGLDFSNLSGFSQLPPISSSGGGDSGGGNGCTPTLSFTPSVGQPCGPSSYGFNHPQTAPDCSLWYCTSTGGPTTWQKQPITQQSGQGISGPPGGTDFSGGAPMPGGGGKVNVVLTVTNDETLDAILKAITYEAIIEVVEGPDSGNQDRVK